MLCLGRVLQHPDSNEAWKNRVTGIQSGKSYRDYDAINGESTEFEWNIFPGFTTLQLCDKISDLLSYLGQTPETFTGRILFMSMFNDISCDRKGNKEECLANARVVKVLARRFGVGQWSFIGPGSEKKWFSGEENSPPGVWDHIADEMLLEFAESGHPTFRATTPLSRGNLKSKGHGKLSIHFAADEFTIDTVFRIILSVNQLSVHGAVAAICEEFENHQDGSGEPDVLMGQSIVLGEIKAEVPLQNENSMNHQILWQQYIERIESACEYKQYCYVGHTAMQCRLGLFQDSDFAGDLEDSKSASGRTLCVFGSHTFVPISWMCKKQTSVSHSSTESEIFSLDAGLRLDGIPALDLRDLIVAILGNTNQSHKERGDLCTNQRQVCSPPHTIQKRKQSQRVISDLDNVDFISSNVNSSRQEASFFVF